MITTNQLNQVANLIGTNDKTVVFGAVLKTLIEAGMSISEAFDELFGAGAFGKFAGNLQDAINA